MAKQGPSGTTQKDFYKYKPVVITHNIKILNSKIDSKF